MSKVGKGPTTVGRRGRVSLFMFGCALGWGTATWPGEMESLGALLGPRSQAVLMSTVPTAIDVAQEACRSTTRSCGIRPVGVADLPTEVQRQLDVFPREVLASTRLYFGVPLDDPSMGIGLLNSLCMMASGGGR